MDVIDQIIGPSATGMLIEAHGPEGRDLDFRVGIELGQCFQIFFSHTGELGNLLDGIVGDEFFVLLEGNRFRLTRITLRLAISAGIAITGGTFFQCMRWPQAVTNVRRALLEIDVLVDESLIHLAILDNVIGDVIENCQVRLRRKNHRNIGQLVGAVLESGQHSDLDVLVRQLAVGQTRPQNRMHFRHVRAPQHKSVSMLDVVIATHRLINAESAHETGHRRGHTVTGVGVNIIGPETGLHQLGSGITFPDSPLPGAEHSQRIRPFRLQGRLGLLFHNIESLLPGDRRKVAILVVLAVRHAQHWRRQAILAVHDFREEIALDTVQAAVNRRIRVALSGHNMAVLRTDQHATAGATETTGCFIPANFP
ncbi:MAG: hypothetical protein ACD_10C00076G0001 [uncultured bacterium]|nr:MAG: hypothetical protein ACD_10C00076G0001 [uncultured bacterium]